MSENRSSFSGRIGFVLAAAGSAVGLGNLWRFPYLAAQYGGGIFVLCYIILALTFGFALMTTEIAIGRKTGLSCIGAYKKLSSKFSFLGYIAWVVPIIILPYYSVIGGWVCKYVAVYLTGQHNAAAEATFFKNFAMNPTSWVEPTGWFLLFLALTAAAVLLGVEKGVERVSKIMMPILIVLMVAISIFVLTLKHEVLDSNGNPTGEVRTALQGLRYYLVPDLSGFTFKTAVKTVCAAMSQLFYSMSLAMGIMITYGSYTKKDTDLVKSVNQIELFDTGVALLAGLMIIPSMFAFKGAEGLAANGPSLMFISLPEVFAQMPLGRFVGLVFFVLVFFAAITSSISLMETIVSMVMDRTRLGRTAACIIIFLVCLAVGIPSALGYGVWDGVRLLGLQFLDFFDFISNSVIMPIVALLTCILIGWIIGTKTITDEVCRNGEKFGRKALYEFMVKYLAPIFLVVILVFSVLSAFKIIEV
ncbi:MAG: sodium-dependent transporter [Ruminococcaceae bacterium]|nr:sodium-dependent transporter [Oscillospiraceae bacterium]